MQCGCRNLVGRDDIYFPRQMIKETRKASLSKSEIARVHMDWDLATKVGNLVKLVFQSTGY